MLPSQVSTHLCAPSVQPVQTPPAGSFVNLLSYFLSAVLCAAAFRAMDKAEREDRMKRAEQKRKDEEQKRR